MPEGPQRQRHRPPSRATHQASFNPNCTCREVVAVEVITPAVGEDSPVAAANTTGFGVLKLVWFSKLKNSARNFRSRRSVNTNLFASDKSVVTNDGPRRAFRPAFP